MPDKQTVQGNVMKNKLTFAVQKMAGLCENYHEVVGEIRSEIKNLESSIASFEAYVPFIGEFSAGKSSLLNVWLGESLLPEDQGYTTALATELRSGESTSMTIVVNENESRSVPSLPTTAAEANAPLASQGLYAICTSPAPNLRAIAPVVPVDMPGTNSNIKRHTDALYRYVNRGAAFFLVIPVDQGTIPATLLAFLEELDLKERPLFVVLHKCDFRPTKTIDVLSEEVLSQCKNLGCPPQALLHTSRMDAHTPDILQEALTSLNADALCVTRHLPAAEELCIRLHSVVRTIRDSSENDSASLDQRIEEYAQTLKDVEEALKRQEGKLRQKMQKMADVVADDVYIELDHNIESLISSAEEGESLFYSRVVGLVNRVYNNSLQQHMDMQFDDLIHNISVSINIDNEKSKEEIEKTKHALENIQYGLGKICEYMKGKSYKAISTTIALTTSLLNPILELAIIFLPEIMSLFYDEKENKRAQIRAKLDSVVFQKIRQQVYDRVQELLPELEKGMLDCIQKEWAGRLAEKREALEYARQEKLKNEHQWLITQQKFTKDIEALDSILALLHEIKNEKRTDSHG